MDGVASLTLSTDAGTRARFETFESIAYTLHAVCVTSIGFLVSAGDLCWVVGGVLRVGVCLCYC